MLLGLTIRDFVLIGLRGQFEQRGLLDPGTHRTFLDSFGGYDAAIAAQETAWQRWRGFVRQGAEATERLARATADEDYLRHAVAELDTAAPHSGEEAELADERSRLMHREKLLEAVNGGLAELSGERGAERAPHPPARLSERGPGK